MMMIVSFTFCEFASFFTSFRLSNLPADGLCHIYVASTISADRLIISVFFGENREKNFVCFYCTRKTGLSRQFYCIANDCLLISSLFYVLFTKKKKKAKLKRHNSQQNEPKMIVI